MKILVKGLFIVSVVLGLGKLTMMLIPETSHRNRIEQDAARKDVEELTAQIDGLRAAQFTLRAKIDAGSVGLKQQYEALNTRRNALKPGDAAALQQFNTEAAAYQARNTELTQLTKDADAKEVQLRELTSKRAELQAELARRPQVVMFSTRSCPACRQAETYFIKNGIPFTQMKVDESQEAAAEYRKLGVNAVPVIIINGQRSVGFSEEWVQHQLQRK